MSVSELSDFQSAADYVTWDAIEIPLKWGVLRGKRLKRDEESLNDNRHPNVRVLGIHGWLDNCNTFDRLVAYFPSYVDFIALDLPGHGYSDHLPYGARYDQVTYVYSIKNASKYLEWDSFIYLGHSMGGSIGHLVAGLFPKLITSLISIDYIGYKGILGSPSVEGVRDEALEFYRIENQISVPPHYTKTEALKRFTNARVYRDSNDPFIDEEASKIIIERSIKPVDNHQGIYTWCHDQRAKIRWFNVFGFQSMYDLVSSLRCPILVIKAKEGIYKDFGPDEINEPNMIAAYSEKCKMFQFVKIPGDHYPHISSAMELSHIINLFIKKQDSYLTSKL